MGWKKWVGVGMILFSGVWFAMIFIVPFTAFSLAIKAVLGLVFFALMEVFFWVGSVIVGKQALSHFWSRFKKRQTSSDGTEEPTPTSAQPKTEK
jgi:hypothetical protein